jgi:hypothetical protein
MVMLEKCSRGINGIKNNKIDDRNLGKVKKLSELLKVNKNGEQMKISALFCCIMVYK